MTLKTLLDGLKILSTNVDENFEVKDNKTKTFINILNSLKIEGKVLVVIKELTDELLAE